MFDNVLKKLFGTTHQRQLKRIQPRVDAINALEAQMKKLDDAALARKTVEFKQKLENGASLDDILIEAFAVCREASQRSLGMRHYDVQLIGGMVLHEGKIAEMKTGEGKTLVATLACYLNALEGKGVHVVTVNDYLARRDAEQMGKLYGFLGLTTGVIAPQQGDAAKKAAYRCDITYGQNNEFGFDYLRDNMKFSIYEYAQRELNFALVDEVDSILVDEARTPLIISGQGEVASEKYIRISALVPKLRKDDHYVIDEKAHGVTLTESGIETAQKLLQDAGLTQDKNGNLYDPVNLESLHILNQCLRAHTLYRRDQQYVVSPDGKVNIVDEFRGRVLEGRRWSDGLHQAVEAKEGVAIQPENRTLATISFQNLFRLYKKLGGMTGTADTEATEFNKIYNLEVVVIPTNRPISRNDYEDLIYKNEPAKFKAVYEQVVDSHQKGQPVLVGTTSVEKSEALARMLEKANVPFNLLNAKQHEREAYVIAQAGRKGAITIATNMAGRGTDIVLGGNAEMLGRHSVMERLAQNPEAFRSAGNEAESLSDPEALELAVEEETRKYQELCAAEKKEVLAVGGLQIIGTERHESRRIDNQLRGRAGRQGDPGASRFFLSLEDDLMRIFAGERLQTMMERLGMEDDVPIEHRMVSRSVENAQKKVEERNFDIRKNLLEYDDVMNQQRKSVYALRKQVLEGRFHTIVSEDDRKKGIEPVSMVKEADPEIRKFAAEIAEQLVKFHGADLVELPRQPMPPGNLPANAPPELRTAWQGAVAQWQVAQAAWENSMREFEAKVRAADVSSLKEIRTQQLEKNVYEIFGCVVNTDKLKNSPKELVDKLVNEISLSLTEQRERLFELTNELVGEIIDKNCPPGKHFEDWNFKGIEEDYKRAFGLEPVNARTFSDVQSLAEKLYDDAEAVLKTKLNAFGPENFLRLFRDVYLREIDRRWLEHLTAMEQLRDGIGLRGYGQNDPKKEYKKEGFSLFVSMLKSIKEKVSSEVFRVEVVTEEQLRQREEQRRAEAAARQGRIQASHPSQLPPGAAPSAALPASNPNDNLDAGSDSTSPQSVAPNGNQSNGNQPSANPFAQPAPQRVETVRREGPKLGRNDPCWCGSGKKYKACHMAADESSTRARG